MRLTSANQRQQRHWLPDAMPSRCCEFVDSRLRRSPPDRASAVPYGQAGEKRHAFPCLAHRSAAARKLHSTPQQDGINLISGNHQTSSRPPAFSLFLPGSCPNNRDHRNASVGFVNSVNAPTVTTVAAPTVSTTSFDTVTTQLGINYVFGRSLTGSILYTFSYQNNGAVLAGGRTGDVVVNQIQFQLSKTF